MKMGLIPALVLTALMCYACAAAESVPTEQRSDTVAYSEQVRDASFEQLLVMAKANDTDGIGAIIRLRDLADPRAVPTLAELMAKYSGTGNVTFCDAAQALFCVGTPEALAVLAKYPPALDQPIAYSIKIAFGHGMAPDKRDAFIRRCYVPMTDKDLTLDLKVESSGEGAAQVFRFTMTFTNVSDHPLTLGEPIYYPAELLLIEDSSGRFNTGSKTVEYHWAPTFDTLNPGGRMAATFQARPGWVEGRHVPEESRDAGTQGDALFLLSHDYELYFGKPGVFKIRAMFNNSRYRGRGAGEISLLPNVWYGAVVSKPVTIDVRAPEPDVRVRSESVPTGKGSATNAEMDVGAIRRKEYSELIRQYVSWTPPRGVDDAANPYRKKLLDVGNGITYVIWTEYSDVTYRPLPVPLIWILGEFGAPITLGMLVKEYRLRPNDRTAISVGACLSDFSVDNLGRTFLPLGEARLRELLRAIYGPARWPAVQAKPTADILKDLKQNVEKIRVECQRRSEPVQG